MSQIPSPGVDRAINGTKIADRSRLHPRNPPQVDRVYTPRFRRKLMGNHSARIPRLTYAAAGAALPKLNPSRTKARLPRKEPALLRRNGTFASATSTPNHTRAANPSAPVTATRKSRLLGCSSTRRHIATATRIPELPELIGKRLPVRVGLKHPIHDSGESVAIANKSTTPLATNGKILPH